MDSAKLDALRTSSSPIIRVAVEALEEIAGADYRGNRPQESTKAYNALEEIVKTRERLDDAIRQHDEKVRAAYRQMAERRMRFTQAWQWGDEAIGQEGSELGKLREEYGLTQDEVEAFADGLLPVPQQVLLEDYPGLPAVDELVVYARIFSRPFPEGSTWAATMRKPGPPDEWSPGGLLNYLLERTGERLLEEERVAEEAGREAAKTLYKCARTGNSAEIALKHLSDREARDARRFIDEHRLRHPENRKLTLDGRPVPDYWDDDGIDEAARTASFVGAS